MKYPLHRKRRNRALALAILCAVVGFAVFWARGRVALWFGARERVVAPPKERPDAMAVNKPMFIIVHHTAGTGEPENITFEAVDRYHREQGWDMIGYHYFIAWDGTLTQGRRDLQPGAHTKENGLNYMSLGVCLAGNYDADLPTRAQIRTLRRLLKDKMAEYGIRATSIYPHRKFTDTKSCYGARLSDRWAYSVAITDDLPDDAPVFPNEVASGRATASDATVQLTRKGTAR